MSMRHRGFCLAAAILLTGCTATTGDLESLAPGETPAIDSDEAGLWMLSRNYEDSMIASGRLETDPALNRYVRGVLCRLSPELCPDVRVYIVRLPYFNATMSANGFMQVWTGLLLRVDNEAQLAYILGHELSHYHRRHQIQQWRDIRNKSGFLAYFSLATAAVGAGYVGHISELAALGSVLAYSREHEREADELGFQLMVDAGYEPNEAVRVWESIEAERKAEDDDEPSVFFATHPSTEERVDTLRRYAGATGSGTRPTRRNDGELLELTRAHRSGWLRDELRLRRYGATEVLLQRLLARGEPAGELKFLLGELYRLRSGEDDEQRAIASYRDAIDAGAAPMETHRSLGLVHWKLGDIVAARRSFQRYLSAAPDAADRDMIETYLKRM